MPITSSGGLAASLAHVLWIGGATDSGKSTVAQLLAEKHGVQAYHYDRFDREAPPGHWGRIDPERHPHMRETRIADREWMWVHTTPEQLVERWLRTTPERFQLTIEDLRSLPSTPSIIAEGYGLTPDLVQPLISSPRQAIWLVSTETFKRAVYTRRGKDTLFADTSDPPRARENHIRRDLLLAQHFREQAVQLELPVLEIDGSLSLGEVIATVEAHFEPFLTRAVT